jgi:hypothetical protein
MSNVKFSRVDNGYLLEVTKIDVLTKRPEVEVLVFKSYDEVIAYLQENKI